MALIYLKDVKLIGQPTGDTCWLTAAEIVWDYFSEGNGWDVVEKNAPSEFNPVTAVKEFQNDKEGKAIQKELFDKAWNKQEGLQPEETINLKYYGLTAIKTPKNKVWTPEMLFHLLEHYGPLWVGGDWGFGYKHAIVVIGVDTTNEHIYYNDPMPEGTGSVKYWEESTMKARLASNGTVMAFTNGNLSADGFNGTVDHLITRFKTHDKAPDGAVKG